MENCQYCGALLPGKVGGGMNPKMDAPEQPELPSWLESLRAHELPGTAAGPQLNYSTGDFVDNDALPSWMRQESAEYISADQSPLRQAAAAPGYDTGGPAFRSGIPANSLIDEQALPPWMQEDQSASPQRNIAASSLVQPDALPEWLRAGTGPGPAGIPASPAPAYVPPRVERVRVPSRPRGDMGPREQSEVAANVFASMLGVASPTPFFPAQPPKGMNASPPPEQLQMGVAAGSQMRTGEPGPMARPSPVPGSYAAGNAGYQQPVAPPYPQANPPVAPNWQIDPNARPVKRGFLETIRSWFSR